MVLWPWIEWRTIIRFVWCHCWLVGEGCAPAVASVACTDWPEVVASRRDESQATTSEISSALIGFPDTKSLKPGIPSSGRPAITTVRRYWSLTRLRNVGSTTGPAFPRTPSPSDPWQLAQSCAKAASPRSGSPRAALYGGRLSVGTSRPFVHL